MNDYLELLRFPLLVILEFIHVLLELLDLRLGRHLLPLRTLQSGLHLCYSALELCNLRTNLNAIGGTFQHGKTGKARVEETHPRGIAATDLLL